jgi:hypothetical protein
MLSELLRQINSYLVTDSTLTELEDWLINHLQSILDSGDQNAMEIANQLDADLVELSEDLIDISTFNNRLQRYIFNAQTIYTEYSFTVSDDAEIFTEITSATPVREGVLQA